MPREGIVRAGGNVDEVKTHMESTEVEIPFVKARKRWRMVLNMVLA